MSIPNPPKLPKILEDFISEFERKFLFELAEPRTKGTVRSSYGNEKETHVIDFSGYFTIIIADTLENFIYETEPSGIEICQRTLPRSGVERLKRKAHGNLN